MVLQRSAAPISYTQQDRMQGLRLRLLNAGALLIRIRFFLGGGGYYTILIIRNPRIVVVLVIISAPFLSGLQAQRLGL